MSAKTDNINRSDILSKVKQIFSKSRQADDSNEQ
jgi:hypothetical protein